MADWPSHIAFETSCGTCALSFSSKALFSLSLPREWDEEPPRFPSVPRPTPTTWDGRVPDFVREAVCRIQAHLSGKFTAYDDLPLDLAALPRFTRLVLEIVRKVPFGQTKTYGEIAHEVGQPTSVRSVGQALRRNPLPLIIPCHRVVATRGRLGGFSAPGGMATKCFLLGIEGVYLSDRVRLAHLPSRASKRRFQ